MAQVLFEGESEILIRKLIELAKGCDLQALKVCIDRLCPPLKAQSSPIHVSIPESKQLSDLATTFTKAAADGKLSLDVMAKMISAVGTRIIETDELNDPRL